MGRPSIPPERLLRALLLQVLYTIRSERQLMASSASPRDDSIAYQSQYSGEYRVYIDRFPNLGDPRIVSGTTSGGMPAPAATVPNSIVVVQGCFEELRGRMAN